MMRGRRSGYRLSRLEAAYNPFHKCRAQGSNSHGSLEGRRFFHDMQDAFEGARAEFFRIGEDKISQFAAFERHCHYLVIDCPGGVDALRAGFEGHAAVDTD